MLKKRLPQALSLHLIDLLLTTCEGTDLRQNKFLLEIKRQRFHQRVELAIHTALTHTTFIKNIIWLTSQTVLFPELVGVFFFSHGSSKSPCLAEVTSSAKTLFEFSEMAHWDFKTWMWRTQACGIWNHRIPKWWNVVSEYPACQHSLGQF